LIRVVYSHRAAEELRAIWRYIATDHNNESAADGILLAIGDKIDLLRDHARLGPRRSDIAEGARMLVEGHFLILYETHPDTDDGPVEAIEIVSIVDGRRDLTELF
jgi:toxin ParE1/3/4